ncbi:hypothetical protein Bcep18194_A5298 [Burkholderia lata]|uniref:Uncharacterized protein n=1 Tax=Burkholderia lata (strain ATCC 17760 / DSM 23089 / LMG 22485 / NCIMB 9086 / R18194 / 383) TaxID=482957 RepID=Q39F74_BURL3|nr:hypothetical protein Bcep18194_A5298 [Burkholderia lata]
MFLAGLEHYADCVFHRLEHTDNIRAPSGVADAFISALVQPAAPRIDCTMPCSIGTRNPLRRKRCGFETASACVATPLDGAVGKRRAATPQFRRACNRV